MSASDHRRYFLEFALMIAVVLLAGLLIGSYIL